MCGIKSKHGARNIVMLLLLLLLVVSPCWSASRWEGLAGLFGEKEPTKQENPTSYQELEESSQENSMKPSQTQEQADLSGLLSAVSALETEFTNYQTDLKSNQDKLTELNSISIALSEQLENLKATDKISEAEYSEIKESLVNNVETNKEADEEIAYLREKLAKAESESGTKGYFALNALMGFEDDMPTWGVGGTIGIRLGSNIMLQAGVDYMLGSFSDGIFPKWDLDNLRASCGIGWMF